MKRKLSDYEPFTSTILRMAARDTRFTCRPGLGQLLQEHPHLVVVFSHSSPLSWIPAPCLLTAHACARGGGHRKPLGVIDRFFFEVPGLRSLASFVTQFDQSLSYDELVQSFASESDTDLVVFPEGSNCFFGSPHDVQPFKSSRFVEISLRVKAPLLLCVHRGSEDWGQSFPVNESFKARLRSLPGPIYSWLDRVLQVDRRLDESGLVTLPSLPMPMERFDMLCELYIPSLTQNDLPQDPIERKHRLAQEGEVIRAQMLTMLAELDQQRAADHLSPERPPLQEAVSRG